MQTLEVDSPLLGMSQREARTALIDAMNAIKQQKNVNQFNIHQLLRQAYVEGVRGALPPEPVYRATFTKRNIQRAVFMARQIGGYDDQLVAAGYRAHK